MITITSGMITVTGMKHSKSVHSHLCTSSCVKMMDLSSYCHPESL